MHTKNLTKWLRAWNHKCKECSANENNNRTLCKDTNKDNRSMHQNRSPWPETTSESASRHVAWYGRNFARMAYTLVSSTLDIPVASNNPHCESIFSVWLPPVCIGRFLPPGSCSHSNWREPARRIANLNSMFACFGISTVPFHNGNCFSFVRSSTPLSDCDMHVHSSQNNPLSCAWYGKAGECLLSWSENKK